jgi:hypothetical protein
MGLTQVNTDGVKDDAVTLAKQAAGTDGQIITYDASGNPKAIGPGTDGQVLTSAGAGAEPAFEDAVSEGTQVKSTGESGGTKFLREDGDGTCSWQTLPSSGAALTGSTDNTVVTVTGANAMQGEANLKFDGSQLDLDTGSGTFNRWKTDQLRFNSTGTAHIDHYTTGQDFKFRTSVSSGADTTCLEIFSNGNVEVSTGNLVIGTAGKGIDFSATGDGSGTDTSELLDDYEEGEFTPVYNTGAGQISNHAYQNGRYIRVGHLCYVSMWIRGANNSGLENGSGDLWITGLPYAPASFPNATINDYTYLSTANDDNYYHWYITAEYYNDRFYVYGKTGSTNQQAMGSDLIAATDLNYRGCFRLA